ncbi:DUF3883 domain-containing protein [Clostridiaceae bacterium M8S5]|nr:DUF3883 domain-containing protein [Clostridiaceae bacterium M8S5]
MSIHHSRHLFLKFNKQYEETKIDTMTEHIKIDNEEGSVVWGAFTRSLTAEGFEKKKIAVLNEQILRGMPTFIFFYSREEGKIFVADYIEWFKRYEITKHTEEINLIPSYYHDRVGVKPDPLKKKLTCKAYLRVSNIRELDESNTNNMFNFENHDVRIYHRLKEKHNFSVSYINISSNLFEILSKEFSSYLQESIEIIQEDKILQLNKTKKSVGVLTEPPHRTDIKKKKALKKKKPQKIDYVKLAKSNDTIGKTGEEFVLNLLKKELKEKGLSNKKVRHVSKKDGDGLGYDILTYNEHGEEVFVEVKATTQGVKSPFYMSSYEREFAIRNKEYYKLFRVFNLDLSTGIGDYYIIEGDIEQQLNFVTDTYRVFR